MDRSLRIRKTVRRTGQSLRKGMKCVTAFMLVLVLLFQHLPLANLRAKAAEGDESLSWKKLGDFQPITAGTGPGNTYILEVSSGTRQGGGAAENVLYFAVNYQSADGYSRTAVVMPTVDGLKNSYKLPNSIGNRDSRRKLVEDTFGYTTTDLNQHKALSSVSTDQFLFRTASDISRIDSIQIFGKKTPSESVWTCQSMRVYQVDQIYGLEMYGWYSDQAYIDFSGTVFAEAVMSSGSGIFRWNNSGGTFTMLSLGAKDRGEPGMSDIILVNAHEKSDFERRYPGMTNHIGMKHQSQAGNILTFRMDFADQGLAGLEALAASYAAGIEPKISELKFCESAALIVRYTDLFGAIREISLPLMLNTLGQIVERLGNVSIAGIAQQGDSIGIPLMLPDFVDLNNISIVLGENEARAQTGLVLKDTDNAVRNSRIEVSKTDGISYTCFAIYRDVELSAAVDGATLKYKFLPGKNNPVQYATATSIDGINVAPGSRNYITLTSYSPNMVLAPVDRLERYLITAYTDDVVNAGTTSDIKMQFKYLSMKDKEVTSDVYNVRDYVRQFYGEWPGNASDFAYCYGFRQGGVVQFMVPLRGVGEFTDISIKVEGGDEWQVGAITIAKVKSYESRVAEWKEIESTERNPLDTSQPRYLSHLSYSREVKTESVSFRIGTVPDPEKPIEPGDDDWEPGTLIQDDGEWTNISGDGEEVSKKEDVDWSKYIHYMTYEDTQQDLGFTKSRAVYKVAVKVAGDKVNPDDDDCGSANLFYFQLVFENGSSGCTLANQQIVGDAFRTGATSEFYISTSQDLGDLVAIQVIPDDQDGNSNIYDKLKIESITVTKETEASVTPTWSAKGDSLDGLGWVGIEYRDPGEMASRQGVEGRTLSEIATYYNVTESSYGAKLMLSITTGPYGQTTTYDYQNRATTRIDSQFIGGVSMSYNYFDREGRLRSVEGIDIIQKMNEYAGRPGSKTRSYQDGTETIVEDVDYYVSNPVYNFRAGKIDNFVITSDDIWQILDMKLQIRSSLVTKWTISKVAAYLINGTGKRVINANGEYDYVYKKGEGPTLIAEWTRGDNLVKDVQTYRTLQDNSIGEINIAFKENEINLDQSIYSKKSVVPAVPNSKNDTLNLYIYPGQGDTVSSPSDYTLNAAVRYTDSTNLMPMQVSAGEMNYGTDQDGKPVYYAIGLNASNMDSFSGVDVLATSRYTATVPISYGILQRIRGGVLVETYVLTGIAEAAYGGTMKAGNRLEPMPTQRVLLQVNKDAEPQTVTAGENDLAVALYFRSSYPGSNQLRSRYVFLSDLGYTTIRPGQLLDLTYDLGEIDEIISMSIVKIGKLNLPIENAYVADVLPDGKVDREWSIEGGMIPQSTPSNIPFRGHVQLLSIDMDTAEDELALSSGHDGAIRMTLGYYDQYGAMQTRVYDDIRPYIESGNGFEAGGKDYIRLLVPGLEEARWIELEPVDNDESKLATWKLARLTATTGLDGRPVTRNVNTQIIEEDPLRVVLTDVILLGNVEVIRKAEEGELDEDGKPAQEVTESETAISVGDEKSFLIDSGKWIRITSRISGSDEGVEAELKLIDPVTGAESDVALDATHTYDETYLENLRVLAAQSAASLVSSEKEREAAIEVIKLVNSILNSRGSLEVEDNEVLFVPPLNFTDEKQVFKLTVKSVENPDASFILNVAVRSQTVDLETAVEAWMKVRTAGDIFILDKDDVEVDSASISAGETVTKILNAGDSVKVVPRAGSSDQLTYKLVSIDPDTNAESAANLDYTHNYTAAYLAGLHLLAEESANASDSSQAEKTAAANLLEIVSDMEQAGKIYMENGTIYFIPPHNYTSSRMKYRLYVTVASSEDTDATTFTLDMTIRNTADGLQSAYNTWNAVRSVGSVTVKDASGNTTETVSVLNGESRSLLLESGGAISVKARVGSSGSFTAAIADYDPASGATGRASFGPTHKYSEAQLAAYEQQARDVLAITDVTDDEIAAAERLLRLVSELRSSEGNYNADARTISFAAPHNYTGSNLYYLITVKDSNGSTLFSLIISVRSEADPIPAAANALAAAKEAGDKERASSGGAESSEGEG